MIRVFISSTFRDMQAEREELVKRVFPLVRHLCESRGVTWGEVDLRWGVTTEQAADGDVLPICLAEIERTRPYFIGLLGQRYGWVPDEIPADLVDELGWLGEAAGRSVTEMEILHGVLNDPEAAGHAFFYLRDPAWVAALPPDQQELYLEDTDRGRELLTDLRDRVRHSGFPVHDYHGPEQLGDQVLADLTALVEGLYPEATPPDPLDRSAHEHAAYAASRFTAFVPRPALTDRLDSYVDGEQAAPLLVTADPGGGGSALVADWVRGLRGRGPGDVVVEHYVGAGGDAADWRALVGRLAGELARSLGVEAPGPDALPDDPPALRALVERVLRDAGVAAAATGRRVVVVVDGVDRLDDVDGAPDLLWLPARLPPGVRAVLTSGRGRPLDTALHREWPVLDVPVLTPPERREFVAAFLARFSKALDDVHVARIASDDMCGNPLYLRTLLDELRQHGDHYTLGEVIGRMLSARTVDDLLEQVLARYEADYERDRPGLVRDAFSLLWAARRGLSETELLELLGTPGSPLPHAFWARLSLAAEQGLVSASGLLRFAHEYLATAVRDRYLADEADRRAAHARLAAYFAGRPLGPRVVDELPWQQWDSGDVDGLVLTLADDAFVELAYVDATSDLMRLWARAEGAGRSMAEAYAPVVADPAAHDPEGAVGPTGRSQLVWAVARLLSDAGHPAEALRLQRYLVEQSRRAPAGLGEGPDGTARLRAALVNLGAALWSQGELDAADPVLVDAVDLCRRAGDAVMLSSALGNLALVRREAGDLDSAEALSDEEGALCRERGDAYALQAHLGNRAQLLRQRGRFDEALEALREQESLCRDLADRAGIARALAGQASVLADRGDVASALALTTAQLEAVRDSGDARGLVEARLNESVMRTQLGQQPEATAAAVEAEQVARRLGDGGLLARVLVARAMATSAGGDWAGAERLAREAELTAREASAWPQAAVALGIAGTARREQGDLAGCRTTHEEELRIAERTDDPQAIASAQANLGTCALAENRFADALAWYAAAEPAFRRLQTHSSLLPMLANRAQVHDMQQNVPAAVADYADAAASAAVLGNAAAVRQWGERGLGLAYQVGDVQRAESLWASLAYAYEEQGDGAALQRALGERALLLINRAQPPGGAVASPSDVDQALLDQAAALLDRQEVLCRSLGDQVGLAACVGNRAIVLRYRGDLDGSLRCLDEQVALSQASGNAQGVLFATANRGEVLGLLGRVDEALAALEWARATAAQYGPALQAMVAQLDGMIAALRGR